MPDDRAARRARHRTASIVAAYPPEQRTCLCGQRGCDAAVAFAALEAADAQAEHYRAALARIAAQPAEPWAGAVARQALAEENDGR